VNILFITSDQQRAGDLEQELMLLWMEAGGKGGVLTEVKETAQFETEIGQGAQQAVGIGSDFF